MFFINHLWCLLHGDMISSWGTRPESPGGFHGSPQPPRPHNAPLSTAGGPETPRRFPPTAGGKGCDDAARHPRRRATRGRWKIARAHLIGRTPTRRKTPKKWWICWMWVNLSWNLFGLYFLMDLDDVWMMDLSGFWLWFFLHSIFFASLEIKTWGGIYVGTEMLSSPGNLWTLPTSRMNKPTTMAHFEATGGPLATS